MIEAKIEKFLPEINETSLKEKRQVLSCTSCLRKLVEVVEVLDIPVEQSIKSKCPCGGSSFLVKLTGKMFTRPLDCVIESINHPTDSEIMVIQCK